MLNKSRFVALPSVRGNQIKMASATIPISTTTACRNTIEIFFITILPSKFYSSKRKYYLLKNNKFLLFIFYVLKIYGARSTSLFSQELSTRRNNTVLIQAFMVLSIFYHPEIPIS